MDGQNRQTITVTLCLNFVANVNDIVSKVCPYLYPGLLTIV